MPRSLLLVVPFVFVACATSPSTPSLRLRAPIATQYTGTVAPAVASDPAGLTVPPLVTPKPGDEAILPGDHGDAPSATVRTWIVELPLAEARQLLADWSNSHVVRDLGFGVRGFHVDRDALLDHVATWTDRGVVRDQPFVVARFDQTATMRSTQQTAAVAGFVFRGGDEPLVLDPTIARFEHGTAIDVRARQDGDSAVIALDWKQSELLRPRTIAALYGGAVGSMEVPVVMQHRLQADVKVAPRDAMVFGVLPTGTPAQVLLLCVETGTPAPATGTAAVAAR